MQHTIVELFGNKYIAIQHENYSVAEIITAERFLAMIDYVRKHVSSDVTIPVSAEGLTNADVLSLVYDLLKDQLG